MAIRIRRECNPLINNNNQIEVRREVEVACRWRNKEQPPCTSGAAALVHVTISQSTKVKRALFVRFHLCKHNHSVTYHKKKKKKKIIMATHHFGSKLHIPNAIINNNKNKRNCSAAILYHYPCPDGAFAALAAHLYFKATSLSSLFFPNTVYRPLRAEDLPLNEIGDLYLLDYVGPSGFVQEISTKVERVIILDHHRTALERLGSESSVSENVVKVIDMERSGATIAFDYFKDKLMRHDNDVVKHQSVLDEFERVRQLFRYIEDGDLWRWRLNNSKAFSSGLKDFNIEFDARINPSLFDQLLSLDLDSVISQGMVSLSHKQKLMDECLRKSYEIALGNGAFGQCLAVNADTALTELRSELGHQLATKSHKLKLRGIGAVVCKVPELKNGQKLKISLRSVDNEDTLPISQEFGGGGHRNASSFMLNYEEFEQWKA